MLDATPLLRAAAGMLPRFAIRHAAMLDATYAHLMLMPPLLLRYVVRCVSLLQDILCCCLR